MKRSSIAFLTVIVASCGEPTIEEYEPHAGVITGTVLVASQPESNDPCVPAPARGNVIVTLFAEDMLPPPEGTSSPLSFIVVPESAFFSVEEQGEGLFAAPFTIPTVPGGRYQVRAFLDADGDFRPTIPLLAQPTAGDVGGGFVDDAGEFRILEVRDDAATPQITVRVGLPIPVERPGFAHSSTTSFTVPYATPQTLILSSRAIQATDVTMKPECTSFLVQYVDVDGDGTPDDSNGDHLPDLYPQVLLRRINGPGETGTILIPGIIDPLPYQDALSVVPAVPTATLAVLLPPLAVEQTADGLTFLPAPPPGEYETIVISGTGQTWQVPNDLAVVQPNDPVDATQMQTVSMIEGPPAPGGGIRGRVQVSSEAEGEVYVVAFDAANPPPPVGTGTPVGLATIPRDAFSGAGAQVREADFAISGLPPATYLLVAILDANDNFSPLVSLLAQPDAGDVLGQGTAPITVATGVVPGAVVQVGQVLPFDRPAFSFDDQISLARTAFPATIRLESHDVPAVGVEDAIFPVTLTEADADADNTPDLLPRVLLTRMVDGADPRTAPNDPRLTIIPGIVNAIPFLSALAGSASVVPTTTLDVVLPPVALVANASGVLEQVSPPPPGRYRVNVLSSTGQTWSVPNDLDIALGRAGGPLADPTQSRYITVEDTGVPGGAIAGTVTLAVAPPADDFSVIVFAFATNDPPPPLGTGRPRAIAIVGKEDFAAGNTASYALGGLATGTYQVRAFLDADDDFVPWYDPLNQPDAGDVGGGHIDTMTAQLLDVSVMALGPPVTGIDVTIVQPLTVPVDRPVFGLVPADARLDLSTGSVAVTLDALSVTTDVLSQMGVFVVQWVDRNRDGTADDVNGDGNPDTYPIVIAQQLDPDDPSNLTLAPDAVRIPGFINPGQFVPAGFPAADPTQVQAQVVATSISMVFPALGARPSDPLTPVRPPEGRYQITVVAPTGQTWTVPNVLMSAAGTALEATQGRYLTVSD